MLLGLVGVSGVGKSYYTNLLVDRLGFRRVQILTTRPPREGDAAGAKLYVSEQELDELRRDGKIAVEFEMLGNRYAYPKESLEREGNCVFELHYEAVPAFKRAYPQLRLLYLSPESLDRAKANVRQRNLSPEVEEARIAEIDEHVRRMREDDKMREMFEGEFCNHYNEESDAEMLALAKNLSGGRYFTEDENFEEIIKKTLGGDDIEESRKIATGWTNIVFDVRTSEGRYVFRFPRDEFWAKTIEKDAEIARLVDGKTDFATVRLELLFDERGRPFTRHRWLDGTPLAEEIDKLSSKEVKVVAQECARFLYQLHNIKIGQAEVFSAKGFGRNLVDFLDELLNVHVPENELGFWDYETLKGQRADCLVHGDFNTSNVLLTADHHIAAILDFGFGGFGNKYDDLGRIVSRDYPDGFMEGLVGEYEKLSNEKLSIDRIKESAALWRNIDQSYIRYMAKVGIYRP